ncbi:trypsin-like peptidase domain-containing protein [Trueperella bernardiae]|uniref:S1C family serine protease n=1 Tax=Trueperella bernardiae TaxID=59561 RepID=UPI002554A05B|nr:trypsin-like peptidase domain-containing protein [Trueperella bernardiae]WIM07509.1 trypsin-like peptidase domain-containing protein [Trueperella bernardiae]
MNEHEERGPADDTSAPQGANPVAGKPEISPAQTLAETPVEDESGARTESAPAASSHEEGPAPMMPAREERPARAEEGPAPAEQTHDAAPTFRPTPAAEQRPSPMPAPVSGQVPNNPERVPGAGAGVVPGAPEHPKVYRSSEAGVPRPAEQPAQTVSQGQAGQAARPTQSGQPAPQAQLSQPAGSSHPTQPLQPTRPTQPLPVAGGFANPNGPSGYGPQPGQPGNPNQPGHPGQPGSGQAPAWATPQPAKKRRRGPGWMALIAVGLIASLLGGSIGVGVVSARWGTARPAAMPTSTTSGVTETVSNVDGTDWQAVAAAVSNAVVSINVSGAKGDTAGSGFIIDEDGHIITNDHVVSGADQVYVTLSDSRVYQAEIVGTDAATDLAVIKLVNPPKDLTVARFGDSSALKVGQPVAAIGNPLGLSSTMTTGIISALDRPVQTVSESSPASATRVVTNAVQIDAAVNPGNSGGPVFDSSGAVIGVASSIATLSGSESSQSGSIGLGFAIPINLAKTIANQLINNGVAEHAFLGVSIVDGVGQADGTNWKGAKIGRVEPGTPAAEANLQEGDVILKIGDRDVASALALTGYVRQFSSGDVVTLLVARTGELVNVDVTLATRADQN